MRGAVGDEITVETDTVGQVRRQGEVLEVLTAAGEHHRVRWADGRESLFFPGPDARIAGALMVTDGNAAPGIVSERDVVRAVAAGADLDTACAADLEATETVWAETTDSIGEVASLMHEADVRHIPLRAQGQLAGVVSVRGVLAVLLPG